MKNIVLVLSFVLMLWGFISVIRHARAAEKETSSDRPRSTDVPAIGWVIIAICSLGFPLFAFLHDADHRPTGDSPTWFMWMVGAVLGFVLSAVSVLAVTAIMRATKDSSTRGDSVDSSAPKPVSVWRRALDFTLNGLLLAYCIHGLWVNDLYIPSYGLHIGIQAQRGGVHLHGIAAELAFAGGLVATLSTQLPLVGRANGANAGIGHRKYAQIGLFLGMGLVMLGVLVGAP